MLVERRSGRWLEQRPFLVVLRVSGRSAVRSGLLWGLVFGGFVASSAWSYVGFYTSRHQRDRLEAAFGPNHALSALFGPFRLQTVAGFTLYKTFVVLLVLGGMWGILTATRLLRGDEEDGHWQLLLCGRTSNRMATAQVLGGVLAGTVALWAVTTAVIGLVGTSHRVDLSLGAAAFYALALASNALMFGALGALASQLASTRRSAATAGGIILGLSYGVRMVADSASGLRWLLWLSPLGWAEQLRPLTDPQPLALLPIAVMVTVAAGVAIHFAGLRDVGSSVVPERATDDAGPFRGGTLGLVIRTVTPTAVVWGATLALSALLLGFVAKGASGAVPSSLTRVFSRFGAHGGTTSEYLSVTFLFMAILVAFLAAALVIGVRREEAMGYLPHVLAQPVSRTRWLLERLVVATVLLVVCGMVAGVCAWLGAESQHADVSLRSFLGAGLNVIPSALCVLGVGALAMGLWPRVTKTATYGLLVWSLLVEVLAGTGSINHWVIDTSIFHQMAAAPAVAPNLTVVASLCTVAVLLTVGGAIGFRRRDLIEG